MKRVLHQSPSWRMSFGEARHRQTSDEELSQAGLPLLGDKEWKLLQKRKSQSFLEGLALSTKLLAAAFGFCFAVVLVLSNSFASKIVFQSTLLRQYGRIKHLQFEANFETFKVIPSSDLEVLEWLRSSQVINQLKSRNHGALRIGLVDFIKPNVREWKALAGGGGSEELAMFRSRSEGEALAWSDIFPLDINRSEEVQNAKCSEMALPQVPENLRLDLVVVSIPCDRGSPYNDSSRDIDRLRAALSAAHIASRTGVGEDMHVVVVTGCRLDPNIFKCKHLLQQQGGIFLYKLHLNSIRALLRLPIGSCKAVQEPLISGNNHPELASRQAYATILHSAKSYICGAVVLAHTIRRSGSTRDLILLVDEHIGVEEKLGLEAAGWKVQTIERIRNPRARRRAYNEWNYSKFRLWQLTEYEKIVFLDSDVIVGRNMDFLFQLPEISAARNHGAVFNSGVMVIEPSQCTFEELVRSIGVVESYNGGDQGYLNEVFTYWHRLPRSFNFLKHFDDDLEENKFKEAMLAAEPDKVHGLHFLGSKPWACVSREFDCNKMFAFSNDAAHRKWWRVYDSMPGKLQRFCKVKRKKARGA